MKGLWKHWKNGRVADVKGVATHTETGEELVIYLYTDDPPGTPLRARPLAMWNETTTSGLPRYVYTGPAATSGRHRA